MNKRNDLLAVAIVGIVAASNAPASHAADVNGVWVSDVAVCQKVFERKGDRVSFADGSDIHGNGFIIDGNQIRGRIAHCTIKARREQAPVVNIVAVCSTDIAIDTMQFRLRIVGPNKLVREFPGMPDLEMNYERCPF
jgi:hypothetical protein